MVCGAILCRQRNGESRTAFLPVFHPDLPPVGFDESTNDGQTQTCPPGPGSGNTVELFEGLRESIFGEAGTVIVNDNDALTVLDGATYPDRGTGGRIQ